MKAFWYLLALASAVEAAWLARQMPWGQDTIAVVALLGVLAVACTFPDQIPFKR